MFQLFSSEKNAEKFIQMENNHFKNFSDRLHFICVESSDARATGRVGRAQKCRLPHPDVAFSDFRVTRGRLSEHYLYKTTFKSHQ